VIDCDVHARAPTIGELSGHLPRYWREYVEQCGFTGSAGLVASYPPGAPTSAAATFEEVRGHLDESGAEIGILTCVYGVETFRNMEFGRAIATAVNDWLAAEWLDGDERLRAAIVVKPEDPPGAVEEIERRAADPRFVQVLLPARSDRPYGNRHHRPIFEAAAAHGLPVAIHFGGSSGNPPTPVGWPSWYLEEVVGMSHVFQAQLISLIAEGTFEALPDLRVVLAESGWVWLPPLMWRLDKEWKGLHREIPWVKRRPSEILREQLRVTTQPVHAPPDPGDLVEVLEQLDAPDLLLHASDFPRPRPTTLRDALDGRMPDGLLERVEDGNPRATYRL
jgi:uncharacterized protein